MDPSVSQSVRQLSLCSTLYVYLYQIYKCVCIYIYIYEVAKGLMFLTSPLVSKTVSPTIPFLSATTPKPSHEI